MLLKKRFFSFGLVRVEVGSSSARVGGKQFSGAGWKNSNPSHPWRAMNAENHVVLKLIFTVLSNNSIESCLLLSLQIMDIEKLTAQNTEKMMTSEINTVKEWGKGGTSL